MRTSTSIVGKDKGGTGHTLCASEAKSDGARCASGTYADRFGVYRSTTARACASTQAIARPDLLTSFADAGFVALAATRLEEDFFFTGSSQTQDSSEPSRWLLSPTTDTEIATLLEG
jgi:hypothetical protein